VSGRNVPKNTENVKENNASPSKTESLRAGSLKKGKKPVERKNCNKADKVGWDIVC